MVSFATSTYNTSEKVGYVMVCAKIVLGTLGRPVNVFASTVIGTATGESCQFCFQFQFDGYVHGFTCMQMNLIYC